MLNHRFFIKVSIAHFLSMNLLPLLALQYANEVLIIMSYELRPVDKEAAYRRCQSELEVGRKEKHREKMARGKQY